MAILYSPTAELSVGKRTEGLNRIAEIRMQHWGDDGKALQRFIDDMRDRRDPLSTENRRALSALFFLANIPSSRHELALNDLTTQEKRALIQAMNQCRAMVSLFPKRLTMSL
ncbi:DUF5347 family protein [[Enterobacter] lignolyticus]|uniref:Prophage protein n=1 Tax=[Enterobacter] lignolyticus TaxID=1334193 RepID=A0A806X9X9_9ENTR|nr:DUF5347 family protein [[Enterobacter] lignolyticus]ALR77752.1 hypothetical protein AO703_16120 [[Enterobacter] lignolyticus]